MRGSMTGGMDGKLIPPAASRLRSPRASRTPRPTPSTEAPSPSRAASASTEVTIWRRVAPRQRSRASSRARWESRIEKVLKMRKMATNRATPAKTRRMSPRMSNPLLTADWVAAMAWDWVWTLKPGPRAAATRPASCVGVTPGLGGRRHVVDAAGLAQDGLGLGQGDADDGGPGQRVGGAVAHQPDHPQGLGPAGPGHLDRLADRDVEVGCGAEVEDRLAGPRWARPPGAG